MGNRYKTMFSNLKKQNQGAFIPFVVLGDPDLQTSLSIIKGLVKGGADALELGIPFSDPIADGEIIQKASLRALSSGVTPKKAFHLVSKIRDEFPELPIGLLVYGNLIEGYGIRNFCKEARKAGVDSLLIADIPVMEIAPYQKEIKKHEIYPVLIFPFNASPETKEKIAKNSEGYLYLLGRKGVTGVDAEVGIPKTETIERLYALGAAPPVLGFGVSRPTHVRAAMVAGCRGVISGSAIVSVVEAITLGKAGVKDLKAFVSQMKKATFLK